MSVQDRRRVGSSAPESIAIPRPRPGAGVTRLLVAGEHAQHVVFAQDDVLGAVDLDVGAAVLADQDPIALLDVERDELAVLGLATGAHGDDLALLRLLLRGVGNDDPALQGLLLLDAADQDAVGERPDFHALPPQEWRPKPGRLNVGGWRHRSRRQPSANVDVIEGVVRFWPSRPAPVCPNGKALLALGACGRQLRKRSARCQVARRRRNKGRGPAGWHVTPPGRARGAPAQGTGAVSNSAWRISPFRKPVLMVPFTVTLSSVTGVRERVKTTIVSRPWSR